MCTSAKMIVMFIFAAFMPFALAFPSRQNRSKPAEPSTRISGGYSTTIYDIPYIVQVNEGYPMCGGSIISRFWVITAGHCLDGSLAERVTIRAGTDQLGVGGVEIQASSLYIHPKFDLDAVDYDIGLIRLASPLFFGPTISAISLAEEKVPVGTPAVVSGWGFLAGGGNNTNPTQLHRVTIPVVSDNECPDYTERRICAGYPDGIESPCFGDSGGPLAVGNTLIGITSTGEDCIGLSIFSNVANLHNWISSVTSI
ncbi:trypsin-7-like [Agrilus planipennis]|uniref:Trypsin-7-like n=1 Tax=Agrilus planipennis TaxID=224129 RepID=A0A1W4WVP1_AGRPL|nr:trypsin-7-like [Agrilus planipennis]